MFCRATAVIALWCSFISSAGCALHKTVQEPAAKYADARNQPAETVWVVAVLTKAGGRVDFPRDNPALLVGDRVVVLAKEDEPVTVKKTDAMITTRNNEIAVAVKGRVYENVRVAAETPESITFLPASTSARREFPLSDIDQCWSQRERTVAPALGGAAIIVIVAIGILIVPFLLAGSW
jgi:hypothetical protein